MVCSPPLASWHGGVYIPQFCVLGSWVRFHDVTSKTFFCLGLLPDLYIWRSPWLFWLAPCFELRFSQFWAGGCSRSAGGCVLHWPDLPSLCHGPWKPAPCKPVGPCPSLTSKGILCYQKYYLIWPRLRVPKESKYQRKIKTIFGQSFLGHSCFPRPRSPTRLPRALVVPLSFPSSLVSPLCLWVRSALGAPRPLAPIIRCAHYFALRGFFVGGSSALARHA